MNSFSTVINESKTNVSQIAVKPLSQKVLVFKSRFIAIASGLELSGSTCDVLSSLELAVAWLVGDAGEMEDQVRISYMRCSRKESFL